MPRQLLQLQGRIGRFGIHYGRFKKSGRHSVAMENDIHGPVLGVETGSKGYTYPLIAP